MDKQDTINISYMRKNTLEKVGCVASVELLVLIGKVLAWR